MPPRAANTPRPAPQALAQIEEAEEDDGYDSDGVTGCLETVHGALRSTDVLVLRQTTKENRARTELDDEISSMIPEDAKKIARALDNGQKTAAYVYLFFWSFSTPPSLFTTPCPVFAWDDSTVWFASPENELAALTAELYVAVPTVFHDYIRYQNEAFVKLFHNTCNNLRSSTVNRLRQNGSVIFASLGVLFSNEQVKLKAEGKWPKTAAKREPLSYTQKLFERLFDRAEVPIFCTLLGFKLKAKVKKGKEGKQYRRWAPILYLHPESPLTEDLFRNPALIIIALIMLYGPSAATGDASVCKFDCRNPLRHGKDRGTTPGLIAFCAILLIQEEHTSQARFLLSPDNNFPNYTTGARSKIDYLGDFNAYKKFLITYWNSSGIEDLIEHWNSKVFPNSWGRSGDAGDESEIGSDSDVDSDIEPEGFDAPERPADNDVAGEDEGHEALGDTSAFVDLGSGHPGGDELDEDDPTDTAVLPGQHPTGWDLRISSQSPIHAVRGSTSNANAMLISASSPRRTSARPAFFGPLSHSNSSHTTSHLRFEYEKAMQKALPSRLPAPDFSQTRKGKEKNFVTSRRHEADEVEIVNPESPTRSGGTTIPAKPKKTKKVFREVIQHVEVEETDDEDVADDHICRSPTPIIAPLGSSARSAASESSGSKRSDNRSPSIGSSAAVESSLQPPLRPKPRMRVAANKPNSKPTELEERALVEESGAMETEPKAKKSKKKATAPAIAPEPRTTRSKAPKNPDFAISWWRCDTAAGGGENIWAAVVTSSRFGSYAPQINGIVTPLDAEIEQ
ncbi:hypothetical protein BKA70DRAFT_1410469 [Coprinopsis sp. MPI-PUGE-AT-0042]|nr:hypothetical protein BKA70DRAFT_1410469 [Coprinopsis sp. MPI-PUGE-AT-0042]